jgi:hypothetical protein
MFVYIEEASAVKSLAFSGRLIFCYSLIKS